MLEVMHLQIPSYWQICSICQREEVIPSVAAANSLQAHLSVPELRASLLPALTPATIDKGLGFGRMDTVLIFQSYLAVMLLKSTKDQKHQL